MYIVDQDYNVISQSMQFNKLDVIRKKELSETILKQSIFPLLESQGLCRIYKLQ